MKSQGHPRVPGAQEVRPWAACPRAFIFHCLGGSCESLQARQGRSLPGPCQDRREQGRVAAPNRVSSYLVDRLRARQANGSCVPPPQESWSCWGPQK